MITKGQLNLNHYKSHETPEKLPINEYINAEVPLDVIGYQVPAGHKIEVSISPTYWPQIWPSKEVANIKVDLEYSQLILPLIDHFKEVQLDYPLSETAQPLEKSFIEKGLEREM